MSRLIENIREAITPGPPPIAVNVRRAPWRPRAALVPLLLAAALFVFPPGVSAKLCGDDVDGQDVPCECGDTVVSDVVLGSDPVVLDVCPADALIIRAPEAGDSISLDLAGHTLRGSGQGAGVWVLHGGPGGARVFSSSGSASIEGFRDGVVAHGPPSIALLEGITVRNSGRDGVRLFDVKDAMIRNVAVEQSGRDGFSIGGKNYVVADTSAVASKRHGYHIMGGGARIGLMDAGNTAEDSGKRGFTVLGMGHRLLDCVSMGSGMEGVKLSGMGHEVANCQVSGNGLDGIGGRGMGWTLSGNAATNNENNGIMVVGSNMSDGGGNSGTGNQGLHQRDPVAQCEIDRTPCVP